MKSHAFSHLTRATAVGLALGLGTVGLVSAQNVRVIELDAGVGCNFKLSIKSVGEQLEVREFTDKEGKPVKSIAAGKGVQLTYTNLDSRASLSFKANGSVAKQTYNPDGTYTVVATGHNGLILFPSDVPAGPTTTMYTGRVVYQVDPATGIFTLLGTSGKSTDVCAVLS